MSTFQFTHPGRGATTSHPTETSALEVSIHAPREGCDPTMRMIVLRDLSFNSRTPGGVRLIIILTIITMAQFQFTHPGRGATDKERILNRLQRVSIHAPREGCDL